VIYFICLVKGRIKMPQKKLLDQEIKKTPKIARLDQMFEDFAGDEYEDYNESSPAVRSAPHKYNAEEDYSAQDDYMPSY
jgi:hypothetical protein